MMPDGPMKDPPCRGQAAMKRCARHGRGYAGSMCPQCVPSCAGEDCPNRVPHAWKKTAHKNQKLKCAGCGAIVVLRGMLLTINRLPRGLVSERLPACRPGRMHGWDVPDSRDGPFTAGCRRCGTRVRVDGYGFEVVRGVVGRVSGGREESAHAGCPDGRPATRHRTCGGMRHSMIAHGHPGHAPRGTAPGRDRDIRGDGECGGDGFRGMGDVPE